MEELRELIRVYRVVARPRPADAARAVPARRLRAEGRRRGQRRHPRVDRADVRPRRQRSAVPAVEGGGGVGARGARRQEPVQEPRPARRDRSATDAGDERHLPRLGSRQAGIDGVARDFYGRQLKDWKGSAEIEQMVPDGMAVYGRLCGWTLARAHARSGDRIAIASYLGGGNTFDRAILDFSRAYAEQNERDYQRSPSGQLRADRRPERVSENQLHFDFVALGSCRRRSPRPTPEPVAERSSRRSASRRLARRGRRECLDGLTVHASSKLDLAACIRRAELAAIAQLGELLELLGRRARAGRCRVAALAASVSCSSCARASPAWRRPSEPRETRRRSAGSESWCRSGPAR